ncbi:MAG: hypothetical protein Q9227_007614 [Pyrenula ochraceoflavens]
MIRPNPLAAETNASLIQDRSKVLTDLQKAIAKCKDVVVMPFERSMEELQVPFSDFIGTYVFTFCLRFDLLTCRVQTARIADSLRMARLLAQLQDPSLELPRLAEVLRQYSITTCKELHGLCAQGIHTARTRAAAPCLELEFHLQAILLDYLSARCVDAKLCLARPPPASPEILQSDHMKRALYLIQIYPDTAGRFSDVLDKFLAFLKKPRVGAFDPPTMYTRHSRDNEIKWGSHVPGYLTKCENGHPFSMKTFENGCPECGTRVKSKEEVYKENERKLNEIGSFAEWNKGEDVNGDTGVSRPEKGVFDPMKYGLKQKMEREASSG